ncbi:cell wall endo-beta-1,3-glucanase [Scheffersomyces xylosifermentans]|uniref:cell wall endo-beta-1,3-glucanase n=1 Tax=Scheffersomyces xylosifermentans TaxID=1304137 RepID=UPI00315C6B23
MDTKEERKESTVDRVKRRVTVTALPLISDSGEAVGNTFTKLEPYKITRSKSSNYFSSVAGSPDLSEWGLPTSKSDKQGDLYTSRSPSVIHHRKISTTGGFMRLDEISPLTNENSAAVSGKADGENLESPNEERLELDEEPTYPYSSILTPVETNYGKQNYSLYHEATSGIQGNNSSTSSSIPAKNIKSYFRWTAMKNCYAILLVIILLLLGGFVPAVVILSNGTKASVMRYFRSDEQRKSLLPYLMDLYGYTGISLPYRQDKEIIALLDDAVEPFFFGLAYSPREAMEPKCGITKREVLLDLTKLSTVTTRIRNYGMQCNQSDFILDSIQSLNLNMTLSMGVWIGGNDTINSIQLESMKKVIEKYPRKLFDSIFIGNEVLYRKDKTPQQLVEYISDVKDFLLTLGYNIPVGTSEIGSLVTEEILSACDIVGANIHPFFSGDSVVNGSSWTFDFLKYQIEPLNVKNTTIIITEVGWPSGGGGYHKAIASIPNLKYLLSEFLCAAREQGYGYYFFEAFDEPWKKIFYSGKDKWETDWGIFTKDRKRKVDFNGLESCQ